VTVNPQFEPCGKRVFFLTRSEEGLPIKRKRQTGATSIVGQSNEREPRPTTASRRLVLLARSQRPLTQLISNFSSQDLRCGARASVATVFAAGGLYRVMAARLSTCSKASAAIS
jgi:hypothetical protein